MRRVIYSPGKHFLVIEGHRIFESEEVMSLSDYAVVLTGTPYTLRKRKVPTPETSLQLYCDRVRPHVRELNSSKKILNVDARTPADSMVKKIAAFIIMHDLGLPEAGRYLSDTKTILETSETSWYWALWTPGILMTLSLFWTPCIFSILSSPLRYNQAAYYASGWYHWLSSFDVRTKLHNHASSWYNLTFKPRCQNEWFPFEVLDMTRHAKRCTCIQVFFVCQMSGTCSGYWRHIPTSSFTAQFHYIIGISSQPWIITVRVTLAKVEQQMENLQEIPVIYYRYLFLHLYEEHGVWTPYSRGATGVPEDTTTVEPNSTSILDMLRRLRSRSPPRNQTEDATPSTTPPTSRPPIFLPGTFGLQPDVERASMALETAIVSALQVAPPHLVRAHIRLILTHHLPRTPISERLAQFAANV